MITVNPPGRRRSLQWKRTRLLLSLFLKSTCCDLHSKLFPFSCIQPHLNAPCRNVNRLLFSNCRRRYGEHKVYWVHFLRLCLHTISAGSRVIWFQVSTFTFLRWLSCYRLRAELVPCRSSQVQWLDLWAQRNDFISTSSFSVCKHPGFHQTDKQSHHTLPQHSPLRLFNFIWMLLAWLCIL